MKKLFTKISLLFIGLMLCAGNAWAAGTYHDPVGDGDGYYEETYGPVTYRIDYTVTNNTPMKIRNAKLHNGTQTAYISALADQVVLTLTREISMVTVELDGETMQERSFTVAIEPGTFTEYTGYIFLPEWNNDNVDKNVFYKNTDNAWPVWSNVFGPNAKVYVWNNTNLARYSEQKGLYMNPETHVDQYYYYWKDNVISANIIDSHNVLHEGDFGTGNALHWALYDDGTLAITGSGAMPDQYIASDFPWYTYRNDILFVSIGKDITRIGNCSFGDGMGNAYSHLYSVIFEEGSVLTAIGNYAFRYATGLYSIVLPNTLTTIGNQAFSQCDKLQSITLPASVTSIGNQAFSMCDNLRTVKVERTTPPSLGSEPFVSSALQTIIIPESTICSYSSSWGYKLGGAYIYKYSVDGEEAYCGERTCGENLNWSFDAVSHTLNIFGTGTTMTDYNYTINNWPNYAPWSNFQQQIRHIVFDTPNLQHIGNGAFCGFKSQSAPYGGLASIDIPATVTSIGEAAFQENSYLASITLPSALTTIGKYAFRACSLTSLVIPSSVVNIGEQAFYNCEYINSVTFEEGSSLTTIGKQAFTKGKFTSFALPESVTSVGDNAFENCNSLTSPIYNSHIFAKLPKNYNEAYTIPNGIETIAGYAFYGCSNLNGITIPNSVITIGEAAFSSCSNLTSVEIPETVTSLGASAFQSCSKLESISIPNSVTSIGSYVFQNCSKLESISIPNSVTSIGSSAFYSTGLTSIDIPNSVTSIGQNAFSWCSKLESVIISNSMTFIDRYTFQNCTTLVSVTIPSSVTEIKARAFNNCSTLTTIHMRGAAPTIEIYEGWSTQKGFDGCSNITMYVPKGLQSSYQTKYGENTYGASSLTIAEEEDVYVFTDETASSTASTLTGLIGTDLTAVTTVRPVQQNSQYNTLCLPFSLNEEQIAKSSLATAEIFKFSGATKDGDELELYFQPVTEITAGVPYFFRYIEEGANFSMLSFADITVETATAGSVTHNGVTLIGTLSQVTVSGSDKLYLAANNELHWSESAKTIPPFRAYFSVAGLPAGARPRARIVEHENVATDIESVQPSVISSQKIIENGQLFILKNGVKYNAQGQVLK